ncbi:TerC family protein [Pokkaliibacter sp. CJK22405]|uniref:TerC family protein n=1 Tax=Pokkaliibacter sp. CJK22405 TaxID=3384615 RepID=UPI003984E385
MKVWEDHTVFEWIMQPEAWMTLLTLTALEIVLGIDNLIFLSILVNRLPEHQRQRGRLIGLALALVTRLLLLLSLSWVMKLTTPLFTLQGNEISGRDVLLIVGGIFLLWKSTQEIHQALSESSEEHAGTAKSASFLWIVLQIAIIDIVFSLDSVITAVGLSQHLAVMVIAVIIAVLIMMIAARPIGDFVERNPTLKMLALSFLLLIGMSLIAEGFDVHVPKGYIYFAMFFSTGVELLNLRMRRGKEKLKHLSPPRP